jgi:hypothetical protein
MKSTSILTLIASGALLFPAAAFAARSPITADEVATALNLAGMRATGKQVVLPADLVATSSTPVLKVESMELWGDHQLKARISCVKSEECLPFFVTVRGSQTEAVVPVVADHSAAAILRETSDSISVVLHAGSRATLLLEGGHVHIQLPVVCMQNGTVGQTIRVSSPDHKQTYVAQITSANLVKGRL